MAQVPGNAKQTEHPITVQVFIVSDATGTGSERVTRTGLVQFRQLFTPVYRRYPFVKTTRQLAEILDKAQEQGAMVIYNITDAEKRRWLAREKERRGILIIDMLEVLLQRVGDYFHGKPELSSRLLPQALGEKSLQLAKAIDFTMLHDDGQHIDTIGQADVILLGVSRSSKTPISFYLSCHYSLKVANVPLILGVEPPEKIFRLKRPRMVGLTINAGNLASVRRSRFVREQPHGYADRSRILEELAFAEEIYDRIKDIMIIDVTDKPVEEICNLIA
ncbi:MAG: kinase/pyrophosphorylase [Deltaproteobacteria bacterium]|nr:kinase/pyrophosphorylase [Deltaproteobacteria bacterium]